MRKFSKLCLIIVSFIIYYYIHMKYISFILGEILIIKNQTIGTILYLVIIIFGTYLISKFISILVSLAKGQHVKPVDMKLIRIIYLVFIAITLLGRGRYLQEMSLVNRFNFDFSGMFNFSGANLSGAVGLYNLLIFIPVKLLYPQMKNVKFIIIVTLLELVQAVFAVGFFDVQDIAYYILSFLIGSLIYRFKRNKHY